MTQSLISAWLSAGALALGTAALIAAPSLLSAALPPVSEVAEPEILTIGDPETQIEVEDPLLLLRFAESYFWIRLRWRPRG